MIIIVVHILSGPPLLLLLILLLQTIHTFHSSKYQLYLIQLAIDTSFLTHSSCFYEIGLEQHICYIRHKISLQGHPPNSNPPKTGASRPSATPRSSSSSTEVMRAPIFSVYFGRLPSFQQSWKCTKGFPKRKIVFQSSPVNFHDCWWEGNPPPKRS